ncbi:MAG: hypothetical protein DRP09_12860 [Candidatus Thorarchaeota archaeon]|nr:MAG: hypothetical protein DRP09_12860 [Candidatus Thorarchaeota archaeon]
MGEEEKKEGKVEYMIIKRRRIKVKPNLEEEAEIVAVTYRYGDFAPRTLFFDGRRYSAEVEHKAIVEDIRKRGELGI